jgi:hypothetical protein
LNNLLLSKKTEWINQAKGLEKDYDIEDIEQKDRDGELTPWLKELISRYSGDIQAKFKDILGNLDYEVIYSN